jgi:RNA polymerase sigma-70 factor (ECF subfamily)
VEDEKIIELFFSREEAALEETAQKYGAYCRAVALDILGSVEDAQECLSDTLLRVWNSIPPQRPKNLRIYLGRIARNLSFDRYRRDHAQKRGGGEVELALEELEACIPSGASPEQEMEEKELTRLIEDFLKSISQRDRIIFVRRYYHAQSVKRIAKDMGMTQSNVSTVLLRSRNKLRLRLEQERIDL